MASSSALVCSDCVWPEHRGQRLDAGARHVVEDVLRRQAPARGLRVRAQRHRFRILRMEALDDLGPQHARRAHLGDLHEVVHADAPEEAEARREGVDIEARLDAGADVFQAVGQRVAEFDVGGRAGFLHVVAADRDAVELRHVRRAVAEDVADDPHGRPRRIDVRVADHELFQNVVLNGAAQVLGGRRPALRRPRCRTP